MANDTLDITEPVDTQDPQTPTPQAPPTPTPDPPSKTLWQKLYDAKAFTNSYDDFVKKYSTPETIEQLHQKLSAAKAYTNTKDEFVKKYFPIQPQPNIIDQSLQADELSKKTVTAKTTGGAGAQMGGQTTQQLPDNAAIKQADEIKADLKKRGVDTEQIVNNLKGLNISPEIKTKLNDLSETNPQQFFRMINHYGWKNKFTQDAQVQLQQAQSTGDQYTADRIQKALVAIDNAPVTANYQINRKNIESAALGIKSVMANPDEFVKKFGNEAALVYGANLLPSKNGEIWYKPGAEKNLTNDETYEAGLNPYQIAGLHYLQDIDPGKYEAFKPLLQPLKNRDGKDIDQRIGFEEIGRRAEELGIKLKYDAAMEMYNDAVKNGDAAGAEILKAEINKTITDSKTIDDRYPLLKIVDAQQKTMDINGRSDNDLQRFAKVSGTAVDNTVQGAWDLLSRPFRSQENYENHLMDVLGNSKINELETHLPTEYQTTINSKMAMDGDAKKAIDAINAQDISKEQKNSQIADYIIKNPSKVRRIQIDPESNISLKSILYGVTDLGASIAPYVLLSTATGGGASAGALRSFSSEFGAAALTMYHDELANAIAREDENPYAAAFRRTTVASIAMAGAGTAGKIRELAAGIKNPAIRQMIEGMSDSAIQDAIVATQKSKSYRILSAIKDKMLQSAKSSAMITPAITLGNIINKKIDNDPISAEQEVKSMGVEALKFFIFGATMGTLGILKSGPGDEISKLSLFEAGKNPNSFNTEINKQLDSGKLTQEQHTELKNNIDIAKKVYDNTPMVDEAGKPLGEKAARNLLFLKFQEAKANDLLKKDIPEKLQEKTQQLLEGLKVEIKQLQLPQPEKKVADTKLSQPIDGVDSQGIPTGDNVPPPVDINEQLKEKGEQVASSIDAERRFSDGERLFAIHEQDETPHEIKSVTEIKNYTHDQLIALPKEDVKKTAEELFTPHKDNPIFMGMGDKPDLAIKYIAEQAQNMSNGKLVTPENPQAYEQMVKSLGGDKELVDAAIAKYPKAEQPKVEQDIFKDRSSTEKALNELTKNDRGANDNLLALTPGRFFGDSNNGKFGNESIADAYHSQKEAGNETDLTKAVEEALGIKSEQPNIKKEQVDAPPVGKANYGNVFQPAKSTTKTLNEKQQELINELPKKRVNYTELTGIGDLSVYVNNPDALNSPHLKSAKAIYEDIKAGKPIRDTPSVNEKMQVMDGQNRIAAQLAAGITDIDVAVIDKSFYDKQNKITENKLENNPTIHYEDKNGNKVITGKDGLKTVVNKDGKEVSAPTKRRVINEHIESYDFSQGEKAPEPVNPLESDSDGMRHIAETSNNPQQLSDIYQNNNTVEKLNNAETAIAEFGMPKVTSASYERFGDKNNINNSMARTYFKNDAQSIDDVAREITDHSGVTVTPQDIADFITRFPNGGEPLKEKPNEIAKTAAERFKAITGFELNNKMAEIASMKEPEKLTPSEAKFANDNSFSDIVAKQIVDDAGLTKENLEENKHLFTDFDAPFDLNDYEAVKKLLHGDSETADTGKPGEGQQQGTGNVGDKKTGIQGKEDAQNPPVKQPISNDGEIPGQNEGGVKPDAFEQHVDDAAEKIIDFLTPKTMKAIKDAGGNIKQSGISVDQIIKGAAETIKVAYRAGKEIKEAIEDAIDYVKQNWDPHWGTLPEDKLRKLFEDSMEQKLKEDADIKNITREKVAEILKKNAANKKFTDSIKNSNIVQAMKKIWTGTIRAFHPFLLDGKEQGRDAAMIIRKNTGTEAHENVVADTASKEALSFWNKQKRVDNVAFMLSMENPDSFGGIHGDQRALALEYRNRMDRVFDMISKIKDVNFIDDYFPHFWKKPDKARTTLPNLGKAPLEGNKSFLKQRFYSNIMEGLNSGLELATYNPEEMVRLAEQNALHFKTANDIFTDLKQKGLLKYFTGKPEEGWVKIDDPMFNKKGAYIDKAGDAQRSEGAYYAKDAVSSVLNNFTAKGLFKSGGAIGTTTKAIRYYNNLKNQVQLGLGLFHFTTTSIDATVTGWGNAIKLITTGKPLLMAKGAFDLVKSATILPNLITTFIKGYKANKEYREGAASQEVNDLVQAGGRTQMQKIYAIDAAYNMKKSWQNFTADHKPADLGKAFWNGIFVLPEKLVGHYLMDVWVPGLKTGGYINTLKTEIAANPNMDARQTLKMKQRIWDSMDNRLGQVVYDNVFWDKTVKDLGFMSIRSLGWTGGTVKAFGTGVADIPKSLKNIAQGKGIEHTTAWMLSLPVAVGMYGALYQYMMTGTGPQELKDYFFPKDGTKDSDGNPNRVSMPSYMKDVYAYSKDPTTTASHKLAPFMNDMYEMLNNKDFYSVRIYNPDDPAYQKAIDILKFQAGTMVPFSLKQQTGEEKGFFNSLASKQGVEKIMGVMPAAKDIERSDIQNEIAKEAATNYGDEAKTKEQADLFAARHEIKKALRSGIAYKDIPQELRDKAKYEGKSLSTVIKDSKQDYYAIVFKHLKSEQQLKVWGQMNDEDKKLYGKFVHKSNAFKKLFNERDELIKNHPEYKAFVEEMKKIKGGDEDDD